MKYILLVMLVLIVTVNGDESKTPFMNRFKPGFGLHLGTGGGGFNSRLWFDNRFGATLTIHKSWGKEEEGGEGLLLYKFLNQKKVQPYALIGMGIRRTDLDDITPKRYNEAFNEWIIGGGAEYFFDKGKKHSLSVELSYHNGAIKYKNPTSTVIGDEGVQKSTKEYKVPAISFRGLYTFYFSRKKEQDSDKDGINSEKDQCPDKAEDFDGYMDTDGCPEDDNDGDNIADIQDKCPGIPEDIDGFEDSDGCPEDDNDNDGITDLNDSCINKAEDIDGFEDMDGCPELDNDGDGIVDIEDKCPNKKEIINGYKDNDGCPDIEMKQEIVKEIAKLPTEAIQFESGSAILKKSSTTVLESLLQVLNKFEGIAIIIEGHTDNSGNFEKNMKLSQSRADAVATYLIKKGIATDRLFAKGFGDSVPKVSNKTPKGRSVNRRVEFKLKTDR